MTEESTIQIYRLSLDRNSRQRIENASFNMSQLQEVNVTNYPNLTRILDARRGAKRYRLTKILEYLANPEEHSFSPETEDDHREYTDVPISELIGKYGGGSQTYQSVFNLMCACGLAIKHNPNVYDNDHQTFIDEEARNYASKQRSKHRITRKKYYSARVYYHVPKWTADILQTAEALAQRNTGSLTRVIDTYGEDHAQASLDTDRKIPHDTQRARERIDAYISEALILRGYVTKAQIMQAVHVLTTRELTRRRRIKSGKKVSDKNGRKTVNLEPILTAYIPELCKRYDLTYKAPTNEQIKEYGLQNRSWIITRRSAHTQRANGADHKGEQ